MTEVTWRKLYGCQRVNRKIRGVLVFLSIFQCFLFFSVFFKGKAFFFAKFGFFEQNKQSIHVFL